METSEHSELTQVARPPEFDGGTFTIDFLSDNSAGFEVRTRNSLMRHAPNTPLPFAREIGRYRKGEKRELRIGPEFKPKLGLRNPVLQGNELLVDIMPVTFPTYLAISAPEIGKAEREISNPSATSLILLTTEDDGSHKFVVQYRSEKNAMYGDVPGASVAGYLDGKRQKGSAILDPIDTQSIRHNVITEMRQEIGLNFPDITDLRITGLANDKRRIHSEFLLMAKTNLTSLDLGFRAGKGDYFRFTEKFFTIDATVESVEKLLTQVKCPIPPTHTAAFIAAGYSMVVEQQGVEAAENWKQKMQIEVKRNYDEMDNIVKQYYIDNPGEINNVSERKPARKLDGYEPAYLPGQQGLPSLQSELERLNLVESKEKKMVDEILVFDVDGVITEPSDREFDPEIMREIAARLTKGEPVILNTGRSINWVQSRIIARLYHAHNLKDVSALQNLFVVGEFGGSWLTFDEKGLMHTHIDGNIAVSESLQKKAGQIVDEEFSSTMFYDHTKLTMVSAEMKELDPNIPKDEQVNVFKKDQSVLVSRLQALLEEDGVTEMQKIHADTIATNVMNNHVGKDFAMQRVIAWLDQRGIEGRKYIAFGDSNSDVAMARQLHDDGKDVEFVYVGDKTLEGDYPFPVVQTDGKFNKGTKEFLKRE